MNLQNRIVILCWLVMAATSSTGFTPRTLFAQESAQANAPGKTQDPAADKSADSGSQVQEALLNEIHDLTPGGVKDIETLKAGCQAAIRAFLENDPNGALEQFDRLKTQNSQLPPPSLLLAALYFSIGNGSEGSRWLEDAANTHGDLPTVYSAFSRLAIAQGRKTDAMVLLEKCNSLMAKGSWSELEKKFFETTYHDCMADLMLLRNDFGAARGHLELLLNLDSKMAKAIMRMAQVEFRQDNVEECLKRLEEFRKVVPQSRVPEMMMASLFAESGKQEDAEKWIIKALEKYSGDNRVAIEFVDWMVAHEKFAQAEKAIQANEARIGSLPSVLMFKGKMAFAQKRYAEAESLFNSVRATEPSNVEVSTMLAISMAEQDDPDKLNKALEMAKQNVQLQSQNPVAASVLGWIFLKQKNMQGASEWLNRSIQGGRLPSESAYYIAKFLEAQGNNEKALEFVDNALANQGLFLYRQAALELKTSLGKTTDGTLNPPKK